MRNNKNMAMVIVKEKTENKGSISGSVRRLHYSSLSQVNDFIRYKDFKVIYYIESQV